MESMKKIREVAVVRDGGLQYGVQIIEGDNRMVIYMDRENKPRYEDNRYHDFKDFDLSNETHTIAKDIFMTKLDGHVKTELLKIKQLQQLLEDIGVANNIQHITNNINGCLISSATDWQGED